MHPRKTTLLTALLATLATGAATAGDVTISEINTSSGALKEIVAGTLEHAPRFAYRILNGSLRVADVCGAVHEARTDMYGETSFSEPLHPDRSLAQVRHLVVRERSAEGIGADGKPWEIKLNHEQFGTRSGKWYELAFATPMASAVDLSAMRFYVAGNHGLPAFAFMNDGGLLGVYEVQEGRDKLRFASPRKGWSNVTHAVVTEVGKGRDARGALVTLDTEGVLRVNLPIEEEDGWETIVTSFESKVVGNGRYPNTRALFATRRERLLRWTEQGDLYRVDLDTGNEQLVGSSGAFGKGTIQPAGDAFFYIQQQGRFANCPVKEEVIVAEEPKDMSIVAAADELSALADAKYEAIDALGRKSVPSFRGEYQAVAAEVQQLLDEVTQTENTLVKPVRDKLVAFEKKYGDRYDANAKIRELTDQRDYVKDKVNWTQRAIQKWDEYRSGIADALAGKARTYFILGEEAMASASRKDRASQHFLAARPWLEAALKFNPDHSEARKMLATVDANASAAEAANKEAIAKAVWPNDVRVKGDINALKKAMLKYFQERDNGEYHDKGARYFAIRIAHDWYVSKTNILDQPVEWRVSAHVASTVPGDPKHARVHFMEAGVRTQPGDLDFTLQSGGTDAYLIPIERVPADDPAILKESLELISK